MLKYTNPKAECRVISLRVSKYNGFEEHKAEHHDLIDSVKESQQKFHTENKLLTNEDIEFKLTG